MRNHHVEPTGRSRTQGVGARQGRRRSAFLAATAVALSVLLVVGAQAGSATADPPERDHTVTVNSSLEGQFRCGELLLTVTAGTETEIVDSSFKNGFAHYWIERRYDGVTLAGSDGRAYTATAHVNSHFVLIAPDFDNPVRGDEIIHVTFHGGPQGSPGHLNEHLRIRDGVESDEITGPCDYAD